MDYPRWLRTVDTPYFTQTSINLSSETFVRLVKISEIIKKIGSMQKFVGEN